MPLRFVAPAFGMENLRELRNAIERSLYRQAEPELPLTSLVLDPFASPWRHEPEELQEVSLPTTPLNWKQHLADYERQLLQQTLRQQHFNQRLAAQSLGLSYDQLRGLLRKYGISAHPATDEMSE